MARILFVSKYTVEMLHNTLNAHSISYYKSKYIFRKPSQEALDLAKHNIERYYAAVGYTEQFSQFLFLLEKMLPEFFRGATRQEYYSNYTLHCLGKNTRKSVEKYKAFS